MPAADTTQYHDDWNARWQEEYDRSHDPHKASLYADAMVGMNPGINRYGSANDSPDKSRWNAGMGVNIMNEDRPLNGMENLAQRYGGADIQRGTIGAPGVPAYSPEGQRTGVRPPGLPTGASAPPPGMTWDQFLELLAGGRG